MEGLSFNFLIALDEPVDMQKLKQALFRCGEFRWCKKSVEECFVDNLFHCLCAIQITAERFLPKQFFTYCLWAFTNSSSIPFLYATLSILSPDTSDCVLEQFVKRWGVWCRSHCRVFCGA